MAEVLLFIQHGWQNIWKQKTIWLFSASPIVINSILRTYNREEQNLVLLLLYLVVSIVAVVLSVISFIGVPYLAYNFAIGKPATVQETLNAVRIFSGRVLGCSFLGFLFLLPCLLLVLGIALNNSTQPYQISSTLILTFMPLSIFSCLWSFSIFGFFDHDWGIRKSIRNAWSVFSSHFATLALLGILITGTFRIGSAMAGILTVLLQNGFDTAPLGNLNYIDPSTTLSKNMLFVLINGINQTIYSAFFPSVFVLAYLKYRGAKNSSIPQTG